MLQQTVASEEPMDLHLLRLCLPCFGSGEQEAEDEQHSRDVGEDAELAGRVAHLTPAGRSGRSHAASRAATASNGTTTTIVGGSNSARSASLGGAAPSSIARGSL